MFSKEEELNFIRQHSKVAIDAAMAGQWQSAIEENTLILNNYPENIDALNRLGRAYMEVGELELAKETYLKAKDIDPYNNIAIKNLAKLETLQENHASGQQTKGIDPRFFVEEVGKAANVKAVNLAKKKILAGIVAGDEVELVTTEKHILILNENNDTIGWVEPKVEQRLLKLMNGGNKYQATISSASLTEVTVLIRETYQHPSQTGIMSFLTKGIELDNPSVVDKLQRQRMEQEDGLDDDGGAEFGDYDDDATLENEDELDEVDEEKLEDNEEV